MKKVVLFLILIISITGCSKKKNTFDNYTASIRDFQFNLNKEYADEKTSPLTTEDLKEFKALDFFPIDSTYKIVAKFEIKENPILFQMPTTTDRKPFYKTYGKVKFKLNGVPLELSVYQNQELIKDPQYKNYLFIPFTDKTSGLDSYGGGRYIDLEIPKGDTIIIDFNKAYNPYCAYNHKYSCPIPPQENSLPVNIKAGVKAFKK